MSESMPPDGISLLAGQPRPRGANFVPLILLAGLMITGLTGVLGGAPPAKHRVITESVLLDVATPETLRNGMVFETVVEVRAKRPLKELVVGISSGLWRDMSINTMIPTAESEEYATGFHFSLPI